MDAVDCAYSIEGKGPPILFVHGVGGSRQVWTGVIVRLKSEFTCISYDLRGHGESPKPALPFGLDNLVADLEWLRAQIGLDRAHVIGHSLGGMVAPAYARHYPDRVISIGLLSTVAGRSDEERTRTRAVMDAMAQEGVGPALDILVRRWFTDGFIAAHPEIVESRKRQVRKIDPKIYLNAFGIYADTEMLPWLSEIAVPTLVLTGDQDFGCSPRHNEIMADRLPNARLVVLENLRHGILLEAPDRAAQAIVQFLRGLPAQSWPAQQP
jgi:pimeloyl-ACP methyl ester carboxylesterase